MYKKLQVDDIKITLSNEENIYFESLNNNILSPSSSTISNKHFSIDYLKDNITILNISNINNILQNSHLERKLNELISTYYKDNISHKNLTNFINEFNTSGYYSATNKIELIITLRTQIEKKSFNNISKIFCITLLRKSKIQNKLVDLILNPHCRIINIGPISQHISHNRYEGKMTSLFSRKKEIKSLDTLSIVIKVLQYNNIVAMPIYKKDINDIQNILTKIAMKQNNEKPDNKVDKLILEENRHYKRIQKKINTKYIFYDNKAAKEKIEGIVHTQISDMIAESMKIIKSSQFNTETMVKIRARELWLAIKDNQITNKLNARIKSTTILKDQYCRDYKAKHKILHLNITCPINIKQIKLQADNNRTIMSETKTDYLAKKSCISLLQNLKLDHISSKKIDICTQDTLVEECIEEFDGDVYAIHSTYTEVSFDV